MATRSTIALEYADGQVDQIYCHWDGYLSNNGQLLLKHWNDPFKVQAMMNLGDMSSLGDNVGEQHDFDDAAGVKDCTFYGRDRGEEGTEATRFKDFADYKENHQYEEYEYILRTDGNWYVSQYGKPYTLLGEAIAAELVEAELAEDE
jgi:hypothetical protein